MTQKELLYLEDAIGHEESIITIINDIINTIEDKDLGSFMEKEMKKHTDLKCKLMKFMEGKANE